MHREKSELSCPSAQPDMEDARVFGVIGGTADEPRVAYLKEEAVVDPVVFGEIGGLEPTHVFRFAAKCEEHRCAHFNGQRCTLAQRIIEKLDPVVDLLPPCLIRPTCRWFAESGREACLRCPQVVTRIPKGDDRLNQAARVPSSSEIRGEPANVESP
jgi:hypothetical protein